VKKASCLIASLAFCSLVTPTGASRPEGSTAVTACSRLVCLTTSVSQRIYPRDALVSTTLVLSNRSRNLVWIMPTSAEREPAAKNLDESGRTRYPPPFPSPNVDVEWKHVPLQPLLPGAGAMRQQYVILRGDQVVGIVHFRLEGSDASVITLRTPAIRVKLTPGSRPTVFVRTGGAVSALVMPPAMQARGPLLHVGWFSCRLLNGAILYGGSGFYETLSPGPGLPSYVVGDLYGWTPSWTRRLTPGCAHPVEWHLVAGWLNQPVFTISYVRR
jgi:hypothetical protein